MSRGPRVRVSISDGYGESNVLHQRNVRLIIAHARAFAHLQAEFRAKALEDFELVANTLEDVPDSEFPAALTCSP